MLVNYKDNESCPSLLFGSEFLSLHPISTTLKVPLACHCLREWSICFEDETKVYTSHLSIIQQGISTKVVRNYTFSEI